MRAERLELLANDVWAYVFDQLDAEPEWTGIDAGRVAAIVERAYKAAVRAIDPEPAPGPADGAALFCEFFGSGPECIVCEWDRP
jgi:hypothetical protein